MTNRAILAAFLLMAGVAIIAGFDNPLLQLPGFLCLTFVVPLIIDEARRRP